MLNIPRPRTRGECLEEARPCPWVACKHHLLLEQSAAQRTRSHAGPGLVLQAPSAKAARRKQLAPTAPELVVRAWIEDALERLAGLEVSCSLDRADQGPAPEREAARLAGLHHTTLRRRRRAAIQTLATRAKYSNTQGAIASVDASDIKHLGDITRGSSGQPPAPILKNSAIPGSRKTAK